MTNRVFTNLMGEDFIRQDEITKKYSLGITLYTLDNNISNSMNIREIAMPCLQKLADELFLVRYLSIFDKNNFTIVAKVAPTNIWRICRRSRQERSWNRGN